jgi:3-hydroxyisobutyrate dehydrogenase-like beta-hydroxyacid dehydrogenase
MDVGVVGLGRMGEPIARRLLAAGHAVSVFNRTPAKAETVLAAGAEQVASPAEIWDRAEACITMIADDAALRAVTAGEDGLLTTTDGGRTLIDMSTVSTKASAAVAEAARGAGVAYLRAPVSGNPSVVEAGNLGIMVSGPEDAYRRVEALLRDVGPNVFYLGHGEQARVMKLALNLMLAGTAELMAEALVLGEAHGLDRARMLEVMAGSAVGSPFVKYKTPGLVADDYRTTFPSSAMYKDLALALDCGHSAGVPLPVTAVVQQLVQASISSGYADDDFIALVPRLRREAGFPGGDDPDAATPG